MNIEVPKAGQSVHLTTQIPPYSPVGYRLLCSTQKFLSPVVVTLEEANPDACLEIALTACSN